MAITLVSSNGTKKGFQGLTEDLKPIDTKENRIGSGSWLMELDGAKRIFTYDANNINPATDDNWWEV